MEESLSIGFVLIYLIQTSLSFHVCSVVFLNLSSIVSMNPAAAV